MTESALTVPLHPTLTKLRWSHAQRYLLAHAREIYNATSIPSINGGGTMAISDSSCPLPTTPLVMVPTSSDDPIAPVFSQPEQHDCCRVATKLFMTTRPKKNSKLAKQTRCSQETNPRSHLTNILQSLADDLLGFTNVNPLAMRSHFNNTYGAITKTI
jgi:hypothetical protein